MLRRFVAISVPAAILAMVSTAGEAAGRALHLEPVDLGGIAAGDLRDACSGEQASWMALRDVKDPREVLARSPSAGGVSCLLLGRPIDAGIIRASLPHDAGPVGLVLRHHSSEDHLSVLVDPALGAATCLRRRDGRTETVGAGLFEPNGTGRTEIVAALSPRRIEIFVQGERVLDMPAEPAPPGRVGLAAGPRHEAEIGEVAIVSWDGRARLFPAPLRLPATEAGRATTIDLGCFEAGGGDPDPQPQCRFSLGAGSLPGGLSLDPGGRIRGAAEAAVTERFTLRVESGGERASEFAASLRVDGTSWPRFPRDPASGLEPVIAVLYSPDDIGRSVRMSMLGDPDGRLFRLHREHPQIKVVLTSTPANRYLGEGTVLDTQAGAGIWKRLASADELDWIELAGHGYTHSPPGDSDLNHHEFSTSQTGCNVDHGEMGRPAYCRRQMNLAREAYRALGIPDGAVILLRFPGGADSTAAIRAAREAGFLALLGGHHWRRPGREYWLPCGRDCEILEIEDSPLTTMAPSLAAFESRLEDPGTTVTDPARSPGFLAVRDEGLAFAEQVAGEGGILNITDHLWDTFEERQGVPVRYLLLDEVVRGIESRYEGRVWYPRGGELARWLALRRHARVSWKREADHIEVDVKPPGEWFGKGAPGLERASIDVSLPPGWGHPATVLLSEDGGPWRPLEPLGPIEGTSSLPILLPIRGPLRLRIERQTPGASADSPPGGRVSHRRWSDGLSGS